MTQHLTQSRATRGFTLIELLTVIAIIAVLAAIGVGLTSAAKTARINARAQSELQQIATAIEAYKGDRGVYPPDNPLTPAGSPKQRVNPVINPLYYELRGMEVREGKFRARGMEEALDPSDIKAVFGRSGFLNTSVEGGDPSRTYLDPKPASVRRVTLESVQVELLVSPFDWPGTLAGPDGQQEAAPINGLRVNPWRYVSSSPTNNSGGFDLWIDVYTSAKAEKRVFKNW
ncbi:MAG: prepilin-type N-terminal cleavage/methylation domain-containing protein [Verrucomicrobiales bacterium]|nr:prepilin-type N-terminal cleavage/methylation domain-containing protein [Verrucomicrobiales bacterium]